MLLFYDVYCSLCYFVNIEFDICNVLLNILIKRMKYILNIKLYVIFKMDLGY